MTMNKLIEQRKKITHILYIQIISQSIFQCVQLYFPYLPFNTYQGYDTNIFPQQLRLYLCAHVGITGVKFEQSTTFRLLLAKTTHMDR